MPTEDQIDHKNSKEYIVLVGFHQKKHLESQNLSLQILSNLILKKTVFFWVLKVFFGSNTCYLMGDTHFFFSENIL